MVGEAEEEEAVEQRQDYRARRQDVEGLDADVQQEEYDGGNGQVHGGRRLRQRAPRWHEEYEMGEDY